MVTELVTNAVEHGGGSCEVRLGRASGFVRVEDADGVPAAPVVKQLGLRDERGRGTLLVEALTAGWGVDVSCGGKVVWARLPC